MIRYFGTLIRVFCNPDKVFGHPNRSFGHPDMGFRYTNRGFGASSFKGRLNMPKDCEKLLRMIKNSPRMAKNRPRSLKNPLGTPKNSQGQPPSYMLLENKIYDYRINILTYSSPSALRAPPQGGHTLIGSEQCFLHSLPQIIRNMEDDK